MDEDKASKWNSKGLTFHDNGEFEKAIECFEKAIEIDLNYDSAWYNMGLSYNK